MKKIIITIIMLFAAAIVTEAQTPKPPTVAKGNVTTTSGKKISGTNEGEGPIGTATALLLSLGAGTLGYYPKKCVKFKSILILQKINMK